MISMHHFNRVRELSRDGLKPSGIATELGINRKTVRRCLATNGPPQYPKQRSVKTRKDQTRMTDNFQTVCAWKLKSEGYSYNVLRNKRSMNPS